MDVKRAKINDLIPDDRNANQGTERGDFMLSQSLEKFGAGRSVLIDKNSRVIAGNKTTYKFGEIGLQDVIIVKTDGKTLVAVQRTDIDLDSPEGRELAIADNRVGEINLAWSAETLVELSGEVDLSPWFVPEEMASWDVRDSAQDFEPESSAQEIDVDAYEFDCKCPKCGFEFIQQK